MKVRSLTYGTNRDGWTDSFLTKGGLCADKEDLRFFVGGAIMLAKIMRVSAHSVCPCGSDAAVQFMTYLSYSSYSISPLC